jgi:NADH-quinone oxidoreductase subunit N
MNATGYPALLRLTAPEIVLAITGLLVLVLDLSFLRHAALAMRCRWVSIVSAFGCVAALAALKLWFVPGSLPAGMLVANELTQLVQAALLLLALLALLLVGSMRFTSHVGEYCALLLFATTAMMLLVSSQNLLIIFLTIEFLSLSLYVLTAFDKQSPSAAQAGLQYFLFGGMSAGLLLFGMSLLYGLSGSLALTAIAVAVRQSPGDPMLTLAMVMVVAGFGFKIAAAPFHMWAPEVYQGAPTVSAGVIASGSKVASFYTMFVVFCVGLMGASGSAAWGGYAAGWAPLLALLAAVSMLWGNLAAIAQTGFRRLLAYSAIGHAGYVLIALVVHSRQGVAAMVYYVITYGLATLGVFGVLAALEDESIDRIADFAGLAKRAPGVSFCLLIFLLSLAGVPPLAGFFAKFYVFAAALRGAGHLGLLWLVLLALAMSVVSFYYYLKVLKQVYVVAPAEQAGVIRVPYGTRLMLWLTAGLVVILGCLPGLLLDRIAAGLGSFFG